MLRRGQFHRFEGIGGQGGNQERFREFLKLFVKVIEDGLIKSVGLMRMLIIYREHSAGAW